MTSTHKNNNNNKSFNSNDKYTRIQYINQANQAKYILCVCVFCLVLKSVQSCRLVDTPMVNINEIFR